MRLPATTVLLCGLLAGCHSVGDDTSTSRFATLDGTRVHYQDVGHGGTAIVFVHGWASDVTAWRDHVGYVRELVPDVEYHELDGVSHFLMIDDPQRFNVLVADFVRRVRS